MEPSGACSRGIAACRERGRRSSGRRSRGCARATRGARQRAAASRPRTGNGIRHPGAFPDAPAAGAGQRANALHDVILPAVGGLAVVDGQRGDAGQMGGALVEGVEAVDFQVEAAREEWGQFGGGADGEKTFGGEGRSWMLDDGYWIRKPDGYWMPDAGWWLGCWMLGVGCWMFAQDPAQVVIALLVLHVEAQFSALPFDLGAQDGLDARAGGQLGEFHRPMQAVLVGQRNGRQFVLLRQLDNRRDGERGVEERVIAVDVQRDAKAMTNDG